MQLYTLISLVLAIFGGTYTALSAIRVQLEKLIAKAKEDSPVHLTAIQKLHGSDSAMMERCRKYKGSIDRWSRCWYIANAVPMALFTIAVFCIAGYAVFNWEDVAGVSSAGGSLPWAYSRPILKWSLWVNLASLVFGFSFWGLCAYSKYQLSFQHTATIQLQAKSISGQPAA